MKVRPDASVIASSFSDIIPGVVSRGRKETFALAFATGAISAEVSKSAAGKVGTRFTLCSVPVMHVGLNISVQCCVAAIDVGVLILVHTLSRRE